MSRGARNEGDEEPARIGMDYAINGPVGTLVQVLVARLNDDDFGFSKDLKERFQKALAVGGEGAQHACMLITRNLHFLGYRDADWVRAFVLPMFLPYHPLLEAAWIGYADQRTLLPRGISTFREILPGLRALFRKQPDWMDERMDAERLPYIVVIAAFNSTKRQTFLSNTEAREILQLMKADQLANAIYCVKLIATDEKIDQRKRQKFAIRFFSEIWPKENRAQSARTTEAMVRLATQSVEMFKFIAPLVAEFIRPVPEGHFVYYFAGFGQKDEPSLAEKCPDLALTIVDKMVGPTLTDAPYDLGKLVDEIGEANPNLRGDARWKRLNRLARGEG